jgi:Asp-tRNA(Asn)/Glu-tRNA(Gln) amidotransferase A subunit family amidase
MIPSNYLTATETQALLATGGTTTGQIIQEHQARYQERDDQVKAWVCVNHSRAIKESIEGQLSGVVIGVKDIMSMYTNFKEIKVDTKDFPTEHGSPFHQGEEPGVDAPLVRILREAGAHIIGKTVSPISYVKLIRDGR